MSEQPIAELKVYVERAVRPVRCSLVRKRRMRDELLSHLLSIYDDELARTGSDERALREAKRRFGDPADTSAELASSVPRWDWLRCLLERAQIEPHESLPHLVTRHLLLGSSAYLAAFVLALPVQFARRGVSELLLTLHVVLVMAVVTSLFSAAFAFLADRIGRTRFGEAHERSNGACRRYCAIALLILPVMMTVIYVGLGLSTPGASILGLAVLFAPLMPLLLLLLARQAADETRYEEEWASLELDC